ncbi:Histidine phosphatase superfamily (branch 1) [Microbispora rosea]|uniref:Histidine phosphatase superfamily (Branch 1) n=1 Tax=Microbispora rosea TaxID=58117 RepID=A0A1N6VF71_9ACTN|nr:histidine phosphatase family protein [Microbispora rosea]GIH46885.1 hypothetical protein Mro03_20640 [Microbispora rosea subsp. rosea]SIQ76484.1 Histidine phosphatase superfamily (branch 1) [Microbispora rosea]
MAVEIVYETHSITEDNERGIATGWLPGRLSEADPRLRECDYGPLNGGPVSLVAARRAAHIDVPFMGGQSYRQVVEATGSFLHDLVAGWDGARVLIVAHSANRWALDCLLTGARLEDLVDAPFAWQPGWHYTLHTGWRGPGD